jgi:hypothetical protein
MRITGERHLRLVLDEYADYYNTHRPDRALRQSRQAGARIHLLRGANVRFCKGSGSAA